jgi:hypothetical protein
MTTTPGTAHAWRTERAWKDVRRGDTLVLQDGLLRIAGPKLPPVDSASPQYLTFIRAMHDGKAIIDGEGVDSGGASRLLRALLALLRDPRRLGRPQGNGYRLLGPTDHNIIRRCSATMRIPIRIRRYSPSGPTTTSSKIVSRRVGPQDVFDKSSRMPPSRLCRLERLGGWNLAHRIPFGAGIELYDAGENIVENSIGYATSLLSDRNEV